jgi:hypothetical protein
MDDNRIFSVAVAELITRELEQGANPADIAGMLTGMAHAVLDDESGIEDAAVAGAKALRSRLRGTGPIGRIVPPHPLDQWHLGR